MPAYDRPSEPYVSPRSDALINRHVGQDTGTIAKHHGLTHVTPMHESDAENLALYSRNASIPPLGDPIEHIVSHFKFAMTGLAQTMSSAARERLRQHMIDHIDAVLPPADDRPMDFQRAAEAAKMELDYAGGG